MTVRAMVMFMSTFTGPEWATPELRREATNALASGVMQPARDAMLGLADQIADRTGASPRVVDVWLATLMIEGASVLRAWSAGEAIAAGAPVGDVAHAAGYRTGSGMRQASPDIRAFTEARRAADLTGQPITVDVGTFRIDVTPR